MSSSPGFLGSFILSSLVLTSRDENLSLLYILERLFESYLFFSPSTVLGSMASLK